LSHDINSTQNRFSEIIYKNGKFQLYVERTGNEKELSENTLPNTIFRNEQIHKAEIKNELPPIVNKINIGEQNPVTAPAPVEIVDSNAVDIDNYVFQSDFPNSKN